VLIGIKNLGGNLSKDKKICAFYNWVIFFELCNSLLYRFKNFKSDVGYHSEKLKKILRKKYSQDFDDAISNLKNEGFISTVKKQEPKFYILDITQTWSVLKDHGYNVTPLGGGRVHHLD